MDRDLLNFERLKNYTYTERDEERSYDKHDKLTKTQVETYDIAILGQRAYAPPDRARRQAAAGKRSS